MSGWREMVAAARTGSEQTPEAETTAPAGAFAAELESLKAMRCPHVASPERWQQILAEAELLVLRWGDQLSALGWTVPDIFGFDLQHMRGEVGLLFAIRGGRVVLADDRSATILDPDGKKHRVHYRRPDMPEPIWLTGRRR